MWERRDIDEEQSRKTGLHSAPGGNGKGPRGDSIEHAAESKAPEACGDEKESDKGLPSNKKQWEDSIDDTNADHTPGGEGSDSKSWWRFKDGNQTEHKHGNELFDPKAGSWKAKQWNPQGGWPSQHNQGVASSDPCDTY